MARAMLLMLLALAGCGDGGAGEDQAQTDAPLCEPPAGLACPDGMRTEAVADAAGDAVFCYEGEGAQEIRHGLIRSRPEGVLWYSPPPFDEMFGCWPRREDGTQVAYSVAEHYQTADQTGQCFDQNGTETACDSVTDAYDAAWGLTE